MIEAVVAPGDVAWAPIDREVVVWHPADGASFVLDPTAALLWQCLDGESTLGDVLADVAAVAGAALEQVLTDTMPVVASWLAAGIAVDLTDSSTSSPTPTDPPRLRTWRRLMPPPNG